MKTRGVWVVHLMIGEEGGALGKRTKGHHKNLTSVSFNGSLENLAPHDLT